MLRVFPGGSHGPYTSAPLLQVARVRYFVIPGLLQVDHAYKKLLPPQHPSMTCGVSGAAAAGATPIQPDITATAAAQAAARMVLIMSPPISVALATE